MKKSSLLFSVLLLGFVITGSGCQSSSRPEGMPPLSPCTITVTQDGAPLAEALVILKPVGHSVKWSVAAYTDANGAANIKTHVDFPGAPVGEYKVVIDKTENFQEKPDQPDPNNNTMIIPGSPVIVYRLVEKEYTDDKTTPHTVTVAKGNNAFTFDVGKAVRDKM